MRNVLKIGLIIVINIIIIAFLLEIGLRLATPLLPQRLKETATYLTTGTPFEQPWSPAWQPSREFYYALQPGIDNAVQYGSPSVQFRLSTAELWDGGVVGFRNRPVNYRVDAVVVGDSFGFCFTERADCWVNQLEAQTGMGVVNLSQPVTGSTSHLRILETFGAPLQPPLVIWQFFGNDFNEDYGHAVLLETIDPLPDDIPAGDDDGNSLHDWLTRHSVAYAVLEVAFTGRWSGLPQENLPYDRPHQVTFGDYTMQIGGLYERYALDMARERNQVGYDMSRQAFIQAQELVQSWGGQLVIVMIPTREEVYAPLAEPVLGEAWLEALRSSREAMQTLCDDLNMTCYDAFEIFQQYATNDEALYYSDDMHLNPYGNDILTMALVDWLRDLRLIG